MTTTEIIQSRRSIRKFNPGIQIPQEHIDLILEAAMKAPSAMNVRPWEFVVVTSKEKREELIEVHPYSWMMRKAALAIVICVKPTRNETGEYAYPGDCGAAAQNILLQAAELGYGTCWCGEYPVEERVSGLQRVLDVTTIPFCTISVGISDEKPKARGFYDPSRVKYL